MPSEFEQDRPEEGTGYDPYSASTERSRSRRAAGRRRRRATTRTRGLAILLIVVAAAVAGAGAVVIGAAGSTGPERGAKSGAGRSGGRATPRTTAAGTWLVPIMGPQPSVAAENAHTGTGDWRLPGPAADVGGHAYGGVAGYVSAPAVRPGQTERIYVSAPGSAWVTIQLFRIGWYGGTGGREVFMSRRLAAVPQPACTHVHATGLTECDWHPTLALPIPNALPSGVYIAKLRSDRGASDCLFVVQSVRALPLLAQLPTSTYEAYNAWGGDSLYPGGTAGVGLTGTTQGVAVSYDRPYDSVTGAGQFFARDVAMIWFLERYAYPVSYTTSESVDGDPAQLAGHRALIDFGHSEYWSQRQEQAWAHALAGGTSLLFFGSDTLGWRVRYEAATMASSEAASSGHTIVAYKEHAQLDPDAADRTGSFPDRGARLSGSAYLGCITPRLPRSGPPTYRYAAWYPAPARRPAWLFAGAGVSGTTRIPGIVGYELDQRTDLAPPGTEVLGGGAATCMGHGTREPGEPIPGPGENRADTTLYTSPSGAIVFNTGTLGWELGLEPVPSASPDAPLSPDGHLVAITRNLLAHVLAR